MKNTEQRNERRRATYHAKKRLEEIRLTLRDECASYLDFADLASLAKYIETNDVELLEPAGVPETYATAIYDNGGRALDRYTVILNRYRTDANGARLWDSFSMCDNPRHPQGFGQHAEAQRGKHLGKRIKFEDLPKECKDVLTDLEYLEYATEVTQ
jgi:hypothetical protein